MTILLTVNPAEEDDDDHAWMVDEDEDEEARENPLLDWWSPKSEGAGVVKKLDEDMYPVIVAAQAGDDDSKTKVDKRYRKYARSFAMKVLADSGLTGAPAGQAAQEISQDVMERLLVGRNGKRPVISGYMPGKATLATFIGGIVKRVVRERQKTYARGRERAASGRRGEEGGVESEIEAFASEAPTPEETVSADEVDEVDAIDLSPAEARQVQQAIDSGELSDQDEQRAQKMLDRWRTGQAPTKKARRQDEREAIDLAMDAAGGGDGLTSDEANILGLRESGMSYRNIAKELFGTDDKKAVQKVMVRLHRARKSLERTTGTPLRGIEADIGGIGYTARGRKRKNPELVIYFEDVTDIEELLQVGLLDPAGYQACLASLLQCLET